MNKKKASIILSIIICVLVSILLVYIILSSWYNSLITVYDGNSKIVSLSLLDTRTCFVTDNGSVYIMGNYFNEGETGLGLSPNQRIGYKNYRPTLIFNESAISATLTNNGGVIIDQNDRLYYFGMQNTFLKPTLIASDCKKATASYNTVFFVNTSGELYFFDISNPNSMTFVMNDVKDLQYGGYDSICILTNGGKLLCWSCIKSLKQLDSPTLLAENVEKFAYSSYTANEEDGCWGYIDFNGNAHIKLSEYTKPQEINVKSKQIVASYNAIALLCEDGSVVYYGDDFLSSASYYGMKISNNAQALFAGDSSLSILTPEGEVLFWGDSGYGCFGINNRSLYRISNHPYVFK